MHQELKTIKNKIINRIISVTTLLIIPIYFLSVLRIIDIGWQSVFILHTFLFLLFLGQYFFRNRLKFELKTHFLSVIFVIIGAQGLLVFGFVGAYYFCFIAILLNAILIGRKQAVLYFIAITILYSVIALTLIFQYAKPQVDLNEYQLYPSSWIALFFGIIYIAFVILTAAGELYNYFIKTISEKDATSIELKESENRLQDIIDNIPALIFLKDKNSVYKFVNSNFLKVFNVKQPVKGKTDFELFGKKAAEGFRADDKRVINSLKPEKIEETFQHLNKTYTYLTQKLPIITTTKEIELLGTSIDITERKKAEEALYQNEQQLQHIFDNSPAIMLLLNGEAEIIKVNRTGFEFAGSIFDKVLNKKFGEAFNCINSSGGEDCNNSKACENCIIRNTIYNTIHKNKQYNRIETQLALLRNGEVEHFDILLSSSLIAEKPDKIILITIDDISTVRKTEKALIESEAQLKGAETLAKIGHYYYEIGKDNFKWSNELFRIFGVSSDEVIPSYGSFFEYIHPDDKEELNKAFEKSLREKYILHLEHRLLLKNGKLKYVTHKLRTEFNSKGRPVTTMGAIMDITQLKLTQLELIKHKENLEQLVTDRTEELQAANELVLESYEELYTKNELINDQKANLEVSLNHLKEMQAQLIQSEKMASIGILTAGVAHEINNPLNFIYGGCKGLEMYFENNIKEHLEQVNPLFKSIDEGVKRISNIVQGLSQFSTGIQFSNEECEIHTIIDNCLAILYSEIRQKAQVIKNFTEDKHQLEGNISKLHQVILNILQNAIQAIERKGVIKITTSVKAKCLEVIIEDNGCGIEENNIPKITDPFFTTREPGKGTGLGLSVSYKIIKEHGGSLEFSSKINIGTTVSIQLPLIK